MAPCATVTVDSAPDPDPDPPSDDGGGGDERTLNDQSRVVASIDNISMPSRTVAVVDYTLTNEITSGRGRPRVSIVRVFVDGNEVDTFNEEVAVEESVSLTERIEGLSKGQHEICVEAD